MKLGAGGAFRELIGRIGLMWLDKRPLSKANRARRKAARKAKRGGQPEAAEAVNGEYFNEPSEGCGMGNEIIKSLVRHFGSATAGAVVGTGVATADDASIFVNVAIGLLIYGATQGWSVLRKIKNKPRAS